MTPMKISALLALALLTAGLTQPASAQTMQNLKTCQNTAGNADDIIDSCGVFVRTRRAVNGGKAPAAAMSAIFFLRGYAYMRKGDHTRALADYAQALEINPANIGIHTARANIFFTQGDVVRAMAEYSIPINRSKDKGVLAEAYANRGQAYFNNGEYNKAIADFTQAVSYDPKRSAAYLTRAQAYVYIGDSARADADYKEAQRLVPANRDMIEDNRTLEVSWLNYLKEIQQDNDYSNWNAPPLDHVQGVKLAALPPPAAGSCNDAAVHWQSVESMKTRAAYEDHLARFPTCAFAALATARIQAMTGRVAKTCPAGQSLDGDGDCVRAKKPVAAAPARQRPQRAASEGGSAPAALDCSTPAGLFACANHALSRTPLTGRGTNE